MKAITSKLINPKLSTYLIYICGLTLRFKNIKSDVFQSKVVFCSKHNKIHEFKSAYC